MIRDSILSLTVALFTFDQSGAQMFKSSGIKLGVTSANQTFDYSSINTIDTKRKIGFNIAFFAEWLDIAYFSVISQIEYAQRGMATDFNYTTNDPTVIEKVRNYNRTDYLSMPLLAKLTILRGSINPYVCVGPRIDILLGYKSDDGIFNAVYDNFKKTSLGGSGSVGVEIIDILAIKLILEARYNLDFTDSYAAYTLRVRNNSFDLWLGAAL